MKLRLSVKIVMIVYLLIVISFITNWFYFGFHKLREPLFMTLVTTYPIAFVYYFYYIYQYFFVRKDIEQVFPGKTLDLLIANNIDNLSHDHTNSLDIYGTYGICAELAGLTVQYSSDVGIGNTLTISRVEIPYYYDAHSKIVKMIYKKMQNNRESQNIKKQQEIINNLKN